MKIVRCIFNLPKGGNERNPVYPPVKNIKEAFPVTSNLSAVHESPLEKSKKCIVLTIFCPPRYFLDFWAAIKKYSFKFWENISRLRDFRWKLPDFYVNHEHSKTYILFQDSVLDFKVVKYVVLKVESFVHFWKVAWLHIKTCVSMRFKIFHCFWESHLPKMYKVTHFWTNCKLLFLPNILELPWELDSYAES